jgi:hypothetical protein
MIYAPALAVFTISLTLKKEKIMYNRPKTEEERAAASAAHEASRKAEQEQLKIKREEYQILTLEIALEMGAA